MVGPFVRLRPGRPGRRAVLQGLLEMLGDPRRATFEVRDCSRDALCTNQIISAKNLLVPRRRCTPLFDHLGSDEQFVVGTSRLEELRLDLCHDESETLIRKRVHWITNALEEIDTADFEVLNVDGVIDMVIGIEFVEADLDGCCVDHGPTLPDRAVPILVLCREPHAAIERERPRIIGGDLEQHPRRSLLHTP